jgi:hypothetical protein
MAVVPQISPRAATGLPAADVVAVRPNLAALAPVLRSAAGFRVDGPDGRIGVLREVAPADRMVLPERLLVSFGLFIVTTLSIAVADVRSVDATRRRIVVATTPPLRQRSPADLASPPARPDRRAARDEASMTSGSQR